MATNPMQRKARNSFLLGMFITLIIAAVVIFFLIMQLGKAKSEEEKFEYVYVLSEDIKSGVQIDSGKVKEAKVSAQAVGEDTYFAKKTVKGKTVSQSFSADGLYAKIDLKAGTVLTSNMFKEDENELTADVRLQEYNMLTLPSTLQEEDFVDIRLRLGSGQDYIVVSKKCVEKADDTTLWIKLSEDEILTMSNAIVEAYTVKGAKLYVNQYVEPGLQTEATQTYPINKEVYDLILKDPNIVEKAKNALNTRMSQSGATLRNEYLNGAIQEIEPEERKSNVESGTQAEIQLQKEQRIKYLEEI